MVTKGFEMSQDDLSVFHRKHKGDIVVVIMSYVDELGDDLVESPNNCRIMMQPKF